MARISAETRRTELIEAALRVMTRDGVAAASTRAIVAEAGMPLATFHYCFRSRDEMLGELIALVVEREVAAALGAMAAVELPRRSSGLTRLGALLRQSLNGYLVHLENNPDHELVLFELNHYALRTPALRPLAEQQYVRYFAAAEQVLQAAASAAGTGWLVELPVLARLVIILLDGATTTWLVDRDTAATRAAMDSVADLLVAKAVVAQAAPASGAPTVAVSTTGR